MEESIKNLLTEVLGLKPDEFSVEHPSDLSHGDYATNAALIAAKKTGENPKKLAEEFKNKLDVEKLEYIETIKVAGPGFLNFQLSRNFLSAQVEKIISERDAFGSNQTLVGQKIMVEYTQPNPFKPFHIGHLMSNAIGETISRIIEKNGASVTRANYQGDIGPHVAKAIYVLLKKPLPEEVQGVGAQAKYIGICYAEGSDLYEKDPEAKSEIDEINRKLYQREDTALQKIYQQGREITLEAFEVLYKILGTKFDYYFFESELASVGKHIVEQNTGSIFEKSDGAIVFRAEKYDPQLHTRVFINSQGLPTYETKEIGLIFTKFEKENPDLSLVTTAIEQGEYMKVVQKAVSLIHPDYEKRMRHITHGMMRFASGKMSSRKGNVITGETLLEDVRKEVEERAVKNSLTATEREEMLMCVSVAAVKFSILRQAIGRDTVFDFEKSLSFEGDSGPYLLYTAVRAHSVLEKAKTLGLVANASQPSLEVYSLERLLYRFPEVIKRAGDEYAPQLIVSYLLAVASEFNSFYANTVILDNSPETSYKLALTEALYTVMKNGLDVLGIKVPQRM